MALPSTGSISMAQVRTELGLSGAISMGAARVRALAGRASGSISMSHLRGKSDVLMRTVTRGTSGTLRGWSNYAAAGLFGSINSASYGGRTLQGVFANSQKAGTMSVPLTGTALPGWTRVWINGTSYPITWALVKGAALGTGSVPNAHGIFNSNFTVGFS